MSSEYLNWSPASPRSNLNAQPPWGDCSRREARLYKGGSVPRYA